MAPKPPGVSHRPPPRPPASPPRRLRWQAPPREGERAAQLGFHRSSRLHETVRGGAATGQGRPASVRARLPLPGPCLSRAPPPPTGLRRRRAAPPPSRSGKTAPGRLACSSGTPQSLPAARARHTPRLGICRPRRRGARRAAQPPTDADRTGGRGPRERASPTPPPLTLLSQPRTAATGCNLPLPPRGVPTCPPPPSPPPPPPRGAPFDRRGEGPRRRHPPLRGAVAQPPAARIRAALVWSLPFPAVRRRGGERGGGSPVSCRRWLNPPPTP